MKLFRKKFEQPAKTLGTIEIPEELSLIPFVLSEGNNPGMQLMFFALSTCGFCRKAKEFLEERNIEFVHVYVDTLTLAKKVSLRRYVSEHFQASITYPFLVIDQQRWISGFLRIEWEELFAHGTS